MSTWQIVLSCIGIYYLFCVIFMIIEIYRAPEIDPNIDF